MKKTSWFFEKIKKIDKPLTKVTQRMRGRKTWIIKICDVKGNITTDINAIQRITRNHCENLYCNKTENLEDTEKFLETYNLPELNQDDMEN